jgi:hypothetical protein
MAWIDVTSQFATVRYNLPDSEDYCPAVGAVSLCGESTAATAPAAMGSLYGQCRGSFVESASGGQTLTQSGGLWVLGAGTGMEPGGVGGWEEPMLLLPAPQVVTAVRLTLRVSATMAAAFPGGITFCAAAFKASAAGESGDSEFYTFSLADDDSVDQVVLIEPLCGETITVAGIGLATGISNGECACREFGTGGGDAFWIPLRKIEFEGAVVGSFWENFINCSEVTP